MKTALTMLTAALLLLSCRDAGESRLTEGAEKAQDSVLIECAAGGDAAFARACTLARGQGPEGVTLTISAPGGSFRRLLVTNDGRGVVAADGAAPASVTVIDNGRIEVVIEDDRYRLPATVQAEP